MQVAPSGLLRFLNENSGAITALATTVGVVVAGIYTYFTTRLWMVTAQQARSSELQARTSARQLTLLEAQANASLRSFEVLNRPYLRLVAEVKRVALSDSREIDNLAIRAANHGKTPATVVAVEYGVPENEGFVGSTGLLPIEVPSGWEVGVGTVVLPPPPPLPSDHGLDAYLGTWRWVHVYLRYKGLDDQDFSRQAQISMLPDDKKGGSSWTVGSVTPTGHDFESIHRIGHAGASIPRQPRFPDDEESGSDAAYNELSGMPRAEVKHGLRS